MAGQPAGRGGDDTFTFFPTLRDLLLMEDPLWDNPFADACQGLSAPGGGVHPSFMEPGHSFAPASMGELSCQGPRTAGTGLHPLLTLHPLWPTLVDTYYACIKVTAADSASIRAINADRKELDAHVRQLNAGVGHEQYFLGMDVELDDFMRDYIKELEDMKRELEQYMASTDRICADFERRIRDIAPGLGGAAPSGGAGPGAVTTGRNAHMAAGSALAACAAAQQQQGSLLKAALGDAAQGGFVPRHAEEQVHQHLKRRHAACILSLRDEFMRKRKKGKLPSEATTTMKTWWESNVVWPYPTDDEKRVLSEEAGLDATQVNNWFINQRKRHWLKLFPGGAPKTAEEAQQRLMRTYGTLEAAIVVAQRS